jgi:preprotein translocase subunit SecG
VAVSAATGPRARPPEEPEIVESKDLTTVKLALEIGIAITSALLVVLVLLHRGKGGGLSSLFGGGVQSSLSGSSVVERNLDRMTIVVGLVWVILIIGMELHIKLAS